MSEPEVLPRELGGFTLRRVLGTGAFGIVYEAHNQAANRLVALKLLRDCRPDDEAWQRFHQEAQAAARLAHPHCVFVYAVHRLDGAPAIEMELVNGGTLQQRIDSGEMVPIEQALVWAGQLLDGVEAAHRVGVLHRDLKPSNCFLTADGQLKVGDFGLSRLVQSDVRLTRSGSFLGTPLFASPEQVRCEPLDARSDVYSAAATVFHLLAGLPPFVARTYEECIAKVLTTPPPLLHALRPEAPPGLGAVLRRALAKDRSKRPGTCVDLAAELAPFRAGRVELAGVGARLLAIACDMALAGLLFHLLVGLPLGFEVNSDSPLQRLVEVAFLGAYFFITTGLFSGSLGQWLVGVEVRTVAGHQAALRCVALRAVAYPVLPMLLLEGVAAVGALSGHALDAESVLYLLLGTLAWASPAVSLRPGRVFVAWHERWSGTRLVVRNNRDARVVFAPLVATTVAASAEFQPVAPLVDKGVLTATVGGELRLGHDPQLGRDVWLHRWLGEPAPNEWAAAVSEGVRLRLVAGRERAGGCDVFENPGGAALATYARHEVAVPWLHARRILFELANELAANPGSAAFDCLWIDANARLRVLPFRIAGSEAAPDAAGPERLFAKAAQTLLGLTRAAGPRLTSALPLHAEPLVAAVGAERHRYSIGRLRALLATVQRRSAGIGHSMRVRQLVLGLAVPVTLCWMLAPWVGPSYFEQLARIDLTVWADRELAVGLLRASLDGARDDVQRHLDRLEDGDFGGFLVTGQGLMGAGAPTFGSTEIRAVETLLAAASLTDVQMTAMDSALDDHVARVRARRPSPVSEDVEAARRVLAPFDPFIERGILEGRVRAWRRAVWTLGQFALASALLALWLRIQPSWAIVGVGLRRRDGSPASRLRAAWRAAVSWSPWVVAAWCAVGWYEAQLAGWTVSSPKNWGGPLYVLLKVAPKVALVAVAVAVAFRNQVRAVVAALWRRGDTGAAAGVGLADLLAGTRLVAK